MRKQEVYCICSAEQEPGVAADSNYWETVNFLDPDRQEKFHKLMDKKVSVIVGDPIELNDLVLKHNEVGLQKAVLYYAIASLIEK